MYASAFSQTHTSENPDSKALNLASSLTTADGGKISALTTKKLMEREKGIFY